jgi:hypothetical protein
MSIELCSKRSKHKMRKQENANRTSEAFPKLNRRIERNNGSSNGFRRRNICPNVVSVYGVNPVEEDDRSRNHSGIGFLNSCGFVCCSAPISWLKKQP